MKQSSDIQFQENKCLETEEVLTAQPSVLSIKNNSVEELLNIQERDLYENEEGIRLEFQKKVFVLFGVSGSGKTFLLCELFKRSGIPAEKVVFVSPTFFSQSSELLELFRGCKVVTEKFKSADFSRIKNSFCVFDDVGKTLINNPTWTQMIVNKRHAGTGNTIIILAQHISFLPTISRSNLNYFCMFKMQNRPQLKYIYENFFSGMMTLREFYGYVGRMRGRTFIMSDNKTFMKLTVQKK